MSAAPRTLPRLLRAIALLGLVATPLAIPAAASAAPQVTTGLVTRTPFPAAAPAPHPAASATGFLLYLEPNQQPLPCVGEALNISTDPYLGVNACAFTSFDVTGATGTLTADLRSEGSDTAFAHPDVNAPSTPADTSYQVSLEPDDTWVPGKVDLVILESGKEIGRYSFFYKGLVATLTSTGTTTPGTAFDVTGTISEHTGGQLGSTTGVPAAFTLNLVGPASSTPFYHQAVTAGSDGTFTVTVPGSATAGLTAPGTTTIAVQADDASYDDEAAVPPPATGVWAAKHAGSTSKSLLVPSNTLEVVNSFVSSVGWVKPGETYPSIVTVTNNTTAAATPTIALSAPIGTRFLTASGPGTHPVGANAFTWAPGTIAKGASARLVLTSKAKTTTELPTVVWRDLSSTAVLSDPTGQVTSVAHGPKVIPPSSTYDTARYGDRPFPIIPVEYNDRTYAADHTGESLEQKIDDPGVAGSTFNLYQEMSLHQLYPHGAVPSAGIATRAFDEATDDYQFTDVDPTSLNTCAGGATYQTAGLVGTPVYPDRITNGVYNLPGNTAYYGSDSFGSAIVGAQSGVAALQSIDSGCGPTGKLVADAATIADPDIDYSDYDTDKDGVVDFFMAVFAGCGGNGGSQLGMCTSNASDTAPYDNVWPHSSSLEGAYTDPVTGLPGFVTHDQLKDLEDRPLWWTDNTYTHKTTTPGPANLRVMVRVGPYNVNPETAIDKASVISHEYGHSLGLPDFYSIGSRATYADWNLMGEDHSQNMDAYSRQELGWVVPRVLQPGQTTSVKDWTDSKTDIGTIDWQKPDGTPYTLTNGADGTVHNSEMYVAKLPGRTLLDPSAFDSGDKATPSHLWWSGSGNDFGCAPTGGHNLDLKIPGLADLPKGTPVSLTFKSRWDTEWDYDYGYVLTTTDGGATYTSHASANGYTTSNTGVPAGNPNSVGCQTTYDNGITGSSGSYDAGTQTADRLTGTYPAPVFLGDSYDITDLAGAAKGALRFSYSTDPGTARPGWFIDDVKVTATVNGQAKTLYDSDFETSGDPTDTAIFNGGCRDNLKTAGDCTVGWRYTKGGAASEQDHAYYLEMRDRSGFDFDGHGQDDRGSLAWEPGLYVAYDDESHGYGNYGVDDPPAVSPIDSTPTPGSETPNLEDASFNPDTGRSTYTDAKGATPGHVDNYTDPSSASGNWEFAYDCLGFKVTKMTGRDVAGPNNLKGDVDFTMGSGCGTFDYGYLPVTVPTNTPPTAHASATPTSTTTGTPVSFDASTSTDPDAGDTLTYAWDFDSSNGVDFKDATGATAQYAYLAAGTYTATVQVTDSQGATSTATVQVTVTGTTVNNTAPTAVATANPREVVIGQTVSLSSAGSTDAETPSSLAYSWNFGDGGTTTDASTANATVSYTQTGTYTVTLTVKDPQGLSSTATATVTVTAVATPNTKPTAAASATPSTVAVGAPVALSGNGSTDTETPNDLAYSWDFGNGGSTVDAQTKDASVTYAVAGTYTVTLTVTDPQGLSDTAQTMVTVTPVVVPPGDTTAPTIRTSVSPSPVFIQRTSTLSAAGTTDDVSAPEHLTYQWDFRNGGSSVDRTGASIPLSYKTPGVRTFVLTVTDEAGNVARKTIRVPVYRYVPCKATSVTRVGDFRLAHSDRALQGIYCTTTATTKGKDAVRSYFKGDQVIVSRGTARDGGRGAVFVDGRRVADISFRSTSALSFRHLTRLGGFGPGTHSIEVRRIRGKAYLEGFLRFQ